MSQDAQQAIPRDFKGIWIPKEIWLDSRLTYFEKCLISEVHSLDGKDSCYASNEYLANFFGEKVRTIQNGLAKLRKMGYICHESFDGRTRFMKTDLFPKSNNQHFTQQTCKNLHGRDVKSYTPLLEPIHIENKDKNIVVVVKGEKPPVEKKQQEFSKDDLYFNATRLKKDWTPEEMNKALEIYEDSSYPISDPLAYIEGIIKKNRQVEGIQKNKEQSCSQKEKYIQKKNWQKKAESRELEKEKSKSSTTKSEISDKDIGMRLFANWKETL